MTHQQGMSSTTVRSATSTSWWVTDYTKRRSGSASTMMVQYRGITPLKGQMSNPSLSTSMPPPTTVSTHPSRPFPLETLPPWFQHMLTGPGGNCRYSSKLWLTPTTGGWHGRSCITASSMTMLWPSPSKSNSTNMTSMPYRPIWPLVSPASCLPELQSMSQPCKTCPGNWEQYTLGGGRVIAEHAVYTSVCPRWMRSSHARYDMDVQGCPL
jgi:hypothetical protein